MQQISMTRDGCDGQDSLHQRELSDPPMSIVQRLGNRDVEDSYHGIVLSVQDQLWWKARFDTV